jgi:hypothetical protein
MTKTGVQNGKTGGQTGKLSLESEKLKKKLIQEYSIEDVGGLAILQNGLEALDICRQAQHIVAAEGMTVPGDRGNVKAHPLLSVIRDQRAAFLSAIKMLNLDLEPLKPGVGRPPGR